ncbi:DUF6287 domain-containing protein [Lactococcus nasutitermitis]|uniref:DUF6287 domain-containing protein n=1 Tax=Lactococcus nasutitermitis TaxID=1652957 RepID=A0ABV9JDZ0_9LACT|nr:DUF6287 domain-containing protein [Lactococcus nasutitermitis]
MNEHKKGVNVPLFSAIFGLIALAVIIVLVIVHSLSSVGATKTSKVANTLISSTRVSSQKASSSNSSSVTSVNDFSKWETSYSFYYLKSGDTQSSLTISQDGEVTQTQNSSDDRVFTGTASISQDNESVLSYVIDSQKSLTMPEQKTVKADVKIHVTWYNGGGTQDYYGYQTYTGHYVLTDGVARAGGVDEVWLSVAKSGMNLSQIAAGDYSSVAGTWKNGNDTILTISEDGSLVFSGDHSRTQYGKLATGDVLSDNIVCVSFGFTPDPNPAISQGWAFFFTPAGVSPVGKTDRTDSTQDRILQTSTGEGWSVFEEPSDAFYRTN